MNAVYVDKPLETAKWMQKRQSQEQWARVWFAKLCRFHTVAENPSWNFSTQQVIAFLRHRIKLGDPAWKRLKIVEALCLFRKQQPVPNPADLHFIRKRLGELAVQDKRSQRTSVESHQGIERELNIAGKIKPNEPLAIQVLRKKLRLMGRAWNTEKAYVKWVKRFLISKDLLGGEKFKDAQRADVETFLTDLVVDGNVAASTQDQAFFGLAFFFEHVLEQDIGNIESLRIYTHVLLDDDRPVVSPLDSLAAA